MMLEMLGGYYLFYYWFLVFCLVMSFLGLENGEIGLL